MSNRHRNPSRLAQRFAAMAAVGGDPGPLLALEAYRSCPAVAVAA